MFGHFVVAGFGLLLLLTAVTFYRVAQAVHEAGLPGRWLALGLLPLIGLHLVRSAIAWTEGVKPWVGKAAARHRTPEFAEGVGSAAWILVVEGAAEIDAEASMSKMYTLDTAQQYALGPVGVRSTGGRRIELITPRVPRPELRWPWAHLSYAQGHWLVRVGGRTPQPLVLLTLGGQRPDSQPIILGQGQRTVIHSGWSILAGASWLTLYRLPQDEAQDDQEDIRSVSPRHEARDTQGSQLWETEGRHPQDTDPPT
jgi:hypothetical protein